MTEFRLDDAAAAGLVLCMVCVSRHKMTTTTYAPVMKATADSKKRKASNDPYPRSQTMRRREVPPIEHYLIIAAAVCLLDQ
jgi:hypothetical protein